MATSFDVFYLGTVSSLDPTEGNSSAENASSIVGTTFGGTTDPLHDHIQAFSAGSYSGGDSSSYDSNNQFSNDTFRIDGGSLHTFDTLVEYNATITYVDGSTATITALVMQDTSGNLYLVPETSYNADQAALQAGPIQSLTLDSVSIDTANMSANRYAPDYVNVVGGTTGDDSMGVGYTDADGDQITSGADVIDAGEGADTVSAGSGNDTVYGGGGNDVIDAGTGNDLVVGGEGDDTVMLSNSWGDDTVYGDETDGTGGGNNDWLDFSAVTASVTVTFSGSEDGTATDGTNTLTFDNIEGIVGSSRGDTIDASADGSGLYLAGGAGADSITGGTDADEIHGDSGNDRIFASGGADTIWGGTGSDSLRGEDGDDSFILETNFGNDTIIGGETGETAGDTLDLSAGADSVSLIFSGDEAGTITDGTWTARFWQIEHITLTDQNDSIDASASTGGVDVDGGGGADTFIGGSGADTFQAGDGADILWSNEGDDSVDAGAGNDTVWAGAGADTILGGEGDDLLGGDEGADSLSGGGGNDEIWGGLDNDTIDGGLGDDLIGGDTGNDLLTGSDGNDTFSYSPGDGADTITDFNAGNTGGLLDGDLANNDFIDLSGFYDSLSELYADQLDDGILNQSNTTDTEGRSTDYSDNEQFGTGSLTFTGASADSSFYTNENTGVTCFTSGTPILTPSGEVAVDKLRVGDLVATADHGAQPILWIGRSDFDAEELARCPNLRPVLIRAGAFGNRHDLLVSPQHCMALTVPSGKEVFARASHLVLTPLARIANGRRTVSYFHILLGRHEVLFADGARTESFYPGPQALAAMPTKARDQLFAALSVSRSLPIERALGRRARPVLTKQDVLRHLRQPKGRRRSLWATQPCAMAA
ncbi:Hint domain-containing protein [Salipiger sp. P9]|uniref:Hint domain-containing protein n=1 Tax=Salipiger pentaromativorans TaxID=2943193 RepID=UPI0021589742|nr:Hint domain-containing protein [Salipiger pentaromativorans]MCR8550778.1 Hint domain-containing protein [Salipiger pentaromativorans]